MNGIEKDIGRLLAFAESHGNQLASIFEKIEAIHKEGCPQGKQNKEAIGTIRNEVKELQSDTKQIHAKLIKIVAALIIIGHLLGNGAPKILEALM